MQTEIEDFLLQEWLAISQAPISFIASMTVAAVLVWLVMQWAYGVRIDNLRSVIQAKEEAIALLDKRLRETKGAFRSEQLEVDALQSTLGEVPVVDVNLRKKHRLHPCQHARSHGETECVKRTSGSRSLVPKEGRAG